MKYTNFYYVLIALIASSLFFSCKKESVPTIETPEEPETTQYYVFSHDTFYDDDDVQIISADTTEISVSKEYINKLGYKLNASEAEPIPVTIWTRINTAPFVRNIIATEDDGDRMILTTKPGDIGDVFGNAEINLDTKIYIDHSQPEAVTRSGMLVENWDRYTADDGTVHPAVIILEHKAEDDELPVTPQNPTRAGEKVYFTPEDIERSNGSATFGIIDKHWDLGEFSITSPDEIFKVYAEDTSFGVNSNLRLTIDIGWFKISRFQCSLYGNLSLNTTTGIEVKGTLAGFEKEEELAKFNCFTTVFMVGLVPVAVTCDAGLQFVAEGSIAATGKFETEYEMNAPYEVGVLYESGRSWRSIYDTNMTKKCNNFTVSLEGSAEAMAGLEAFAELKLYGAAGPKITFGPHVEAGIYASRELSTEEGDQLKFSTNGRLSLGGEYGVEVKILKWELAAWKHEYSVCGVDLWNKEGSIPLK